MAAWAWRISCALWPLRVNYTLLGTRQSAQAGLELLSSVFETTRVAQKLGHRVDEWTKVSKDNSVLSQFINDDFKRRKLSMFLKTKIIWPRFWDIMTLFLLAKSCVKNKKKALRQQISDVARLSWPPWPVSVFLCWLITSFLSGTWPLPGLASSTQGSRITSELLWNYSGFSAMSLFLEICLIYLWWSDFSLL